MSLPVLAPRIPGVTPQPNDKPISKEHTDEEWEAKKDIIKQLYIGDNRKLNATMAILESKHGFAATEQMYKKRLKKWSIRKRTYRKGSRRSISSSPGQAEDMRAHSNRDAGITPHMDRPGRTQSQYQSMSLIRPAPYSDLEKVLSGVFSWSQGKLESPYIASDPMSVYLANPGQPPIQDSRTMYRTFELGFDLWSQGRGHLAGMAARKGFYVLEFVLTQDHPDLVWHVLDTIYDMVDRGHLQLLRMFLEHATVLARRQLPANHPLLNILEQLRGCDYRTDKGRQYVCYVLRQAWLRNVDLLASHIGTIMPQQLWLYEQLIWDGRTRLRRDSELAKQREALNNALGRLISTHEQELADDGPDRLRTQALRLEFTQMDLGDKERAEQLAMDLLRQTESEDGSPASARFHAYARKMLARVQQDRQDWETAEANLRWAINKRETAHGTNNDLRVIRDMWVLANHFQRVGKLEEAAQITDDAASRAQQYLTNVGG